MVWCGLVTKGIKLVADVLDVRMRDRSQEGGGGISDNNVEERYIN